jgi:catechol 2,3-dioxygenase-like lactoylglutathione lyase family enzyme
MINTYGLSHINLEVKDPDRSLRFYQQLFGVREYYRDADSIQVLGPGEKDVLAFVRSEQAGKQGGLSHFGFRLKDPADIHEAVQLATRLGATIKSTGEFSPGYPYLYLLDPDGYEIEIWYE